MDWRTKARRDLGSLYEETCRQERHIVQAILDIETLTASQWSERREHIDSHILAIPSIVDSLNQIDEATNDT